MYTFLIKPTNNCNLRCKYCFIDNAIKSSSEMMTIDLAMLTIDKIAIFLKSRNIHGCKILWHGGEPLLWSAEKYRTILHYMTEKYARFTWRNSMQTNLTLLTDEHIKVFQNFGVQLSTSMDGYEELHNKTRITSTGEGSHHTVISKIKALKERKICTGVIVVLSSENVDKIIDIYNYFKSINMGFMVNPLLNEGEGRKNNLSITTEKYTEAMVKLFDYWFEDVDAIPVSNFIEWASSLVTKQTTICVFCRNCQNIFTVIEPNGDISACDRLCGQKEYIYGNIKNSNLGNILDIKRKIFDDRSRILSKTECNGCKYWNICYGGCPSESAGGLHNIMRRTRYCESYMNLYDHIEKTIKNNKQILL